MSVFRVLKGPIRFVKLTEILVINHLLVSFTRIKHGVVYQHYVWLDSILPTCIGISIWHVQMNTEEKIIAGNGQVGSQQYDV